MTTLTAPAPTTRRHTDVAHHHPEVVRTLGGWSWACSCGAAGRRVSPAASWRHALIEALSHSTQLAA